MAKARTNPPNEAGLPAGGWLIALRFFWAILALLTVAALFGDVIIWAVKGTQYALSPGFGRLGTKMAGFNEVVLVGVYGGFVKDKIEKHWEGKGRKAWLLAGLLSLIVYLLAGLPLVAFMLVFVRHFWGGHLHIVRLGAALVAHPIGIFWLLLVTTILYAIFACKWFVVSQVCGFAGPLFKRQPERRYMIGSE